MLTNKILTIQEHQEKIGSRFLLAQLVMARTRQLIKGAPISKGMGTVGSEFNPKRRGEIPNHRFPKIALEELRTNRLHWERKPVVELPTIEIEPVVFGS